VSGCELLDPPPPPPPRSGVDLVCAGVLFGCVLEFGAGVKFCAGGVGFAGAGEKFCAGGFGVKLGVLGFCELVCVLVFVTKISSTPFFSFYFLSNCFVTVMLTYYITKSI
jgi:hypothetical protein